MKSKILLILALAIPALSFSQEIITGLSTNPVIKANRKLYKEKPAKNVMLTLPFLDDFSGTGIFPDTKLWANNYVFINSSYPYMPPTLGVATFDALNDTGALYSEASSSNFIADSLTSNPIRLDSAYKKSDSLYLSFLYQPGGIGNAPETDDSLVLEFYSPVTGEWRHTWSSEGMTLAQFHSKYKVWFKQVMIPITDSVRYFQKGFRFRFYNYASLANNNYPTWAGNVDIWNIDYVYLNKGRSKSDSVYKDIAFMQAAPSVLKKYYSMPWSQFMANIAGELKTSLQMFIVNLNTSTYLCNYEYVIFNESGDSIAGYNGGACNLLPYYQTGPQTCTNCAQHACPPYSFSFPSSTADSASFKIVHSIREGILGDYLRKNDTTVFYQNFYNYYAYDDGVPEAGYGLSPANSQLAYKFTLNHPDTIRAVNMFFNQTLNNASQQYFYLTIWNDKNGYPNDTVYQEKNLKPQYCDSLNEFYTYRLKNQSIVLSGTFYVGWKQLTGDNLNVGFDLNNDEHSNTFYNTGSGWTNSDISGALMIRPVLGKALPLNVGIKETHKSLGSLKVFPNPSNGETVSIALPAEANRDISKLKIHLFDILGNNVYKSAFTNTLNISGLQNGIYMLSVSADDNSIRYFTKLTIVK